MPTYTGRSTIANRDDTDTLVVSWAEYINNLECDLADAYWTGEEPELELLRQRLNVAKGNRERDGGDYYISL